MENEPTENEKKSALFWPDKPETAATAIAAQITEHGPLVSIRLEILDGAWDGMARFHTTHK